MILKRAFCPNARSIRQRRIYNPMARYSLNVDDPGYPAYLEARAMGLTVHCFLDGVKVSQVTVADEEAGIIVRAAKDAQGNLVVEGDQIKHETLHGRVKCYLSRRVQRSEGDI